jgi:hypothetical protein
MSLLTAEEEEKYMYIIIISLIQIFKIYIDMPMA